MAYFCEYVYVAWISSIRVHIISCVPRTAIVPVFAKTRKVTSILHQTEDTYLSET